MSSGFNTDVTRSERVFHVQTEDRGPQHPTIDTVVYQNGRILHRHSYNYSALAASGDFSTGMLRERVENQHREIIESLREGELDESIAAAEARALQSGGIQVQLLNSTSWLSAGKVSLEVGVIRKADNLPISGARIEACIDGALCSGRHAGQSDDQGRAKIEFDMPPLGKGDLALVIEAQAESLKDAIRFSMRSRAKVPQSGTFPGPGK
jgi:hypothetical protein